MSVREPLLRKRLIKDFNWTENSPGFEDEDDYFYVIELTRAYDALGDAQIRLQRIMGICHEDWEYTLEYGPFYSEGMTKLVNLRKEIFSIIESEGKVP